MTEPVVESRYVCQARLPVWGGAAGQAKLAESTVAVVGVGATGSGIAESLVRAGVGTTRLIDRDILELSNLQRQTLYDEEDLAAGLPKAEAARRRLSRINSAVDVEARVADLEASNVMALLEGVDLVLDGTDNFQARFLINDACASLEIPWVYAGVVGTTVHGFPIVPGHTSCFRCYLRTPPPPGSVETCQTAGVLGGAVLVASGLAAAEGIKLLLGERDSVGGLFIIDVWARDARRVTIPRDPECPTCQGRYDFLDASRGTGPGGHAELCGQDAVALRVPAATLDLERLAARLQPLGELTVRNAFLLRFCPRESPELLMTVFQDGRALVKGTVDPATARGAYAKYVGV